MLLNFKKGNMWTAYNDADLFLITTNSTIKNNGALVMGAGIAKEARDRFPGLDLALGKQITHFGKYGLLVSENYKKGKKLGAFQVKYSYAEPAKLSLIEYSCQCLQMWIEYHLEKYPKIHLNFPGIGNGKLDRELVLDILETELYYPYLTIWEKE